MNETDRPAHRLRDCFVALVLVALLSGGCVDMSYNRLAIGQGPSQYGRILPAEDSRKTELGICSLIRGSTGRVDAIIALTSSNRRIYGKLQTTRIERNYGLGPQVDFVLRGEIDPKQADLAEAGPVDLLRATLADLLSYKGERLTSEVCGWNAAALVRVLQSYPQAGEPDSAHPGLAEWLDRAPTGGQTSVSLDARGIYRLEYRVGRVR